jgi:hypothetical protein
MASSAPTPVPAVREAVASFGDRRQFRQAVAALLAAGFEAADLSALASHESLQAVEQNRGELIAAGLTGEVKYIDLLTDAGIILVSGGPIAMILAALVGAGVGGAALKEFFDDYMAAPHREEFSAALKAGAALLWVRCADREHELRATHILEQAGGRLTHTHDRPLHQAAER